jgi:hypothetical protein
MKIIIPQHTYPFCLLVTKKKDEQCEKSDVFLIEELKEAAKHLATGFKFSFTTRDWDQVCNHPHNCHMAVH